MDKAKPTTSTVIASLLIDNPSRRSVAKLASHRYLRRALVMIIGTTLLLLAFAAAAIAYVEYASAAIFRSVGEAPVRKVALVFGAGVTRDGRPTAALADRVTAAAELYRAGRVQHILMSGDNGSTNYDEVTVMQRYAMALGVPSKAITLDYAGFRTYDSCYRAREIFGVQRAVLVTQRYHLPRALYTCQELGLDVIGLAADALPQSRRSAYANLLAGYIRRERLATLLMLWEVHVTRPLPRFLGPSEPIPVTSDE